MFLLFGLVSRVERWLIRGTGRAAAIAADKKSFDLCDDSEGLGVAKILSDPEYLKLFGYGPAAEAEKKKELAEKEAAAAKENGTALKGANGSTDVPPTAAGITA